MERYGMRRRFGNGHRQERAPRRQRWSPHNWRFVLPVAALAMVLGACTSESPVKPGQRSLSPDGPVLGVTDPFNDQGFCLAKDAWLAGFTSGVNDSLDLADEHNCTSNDVRIASAEIVEYSLDGQNFVPFTGAPVTCQENTPIFVRLNAQVDETATSERTDIGIWISQDGGNARTGVCNHYNLVAPGPTYPAAGSTVNGVTNYEGDQCGDMINGNATGTGINGVALGVINAVCQTSGAPTSTLLHIG